MLERLLALCLRLVDCPNGPAEAKLKAEIGSLAKALWLD